MMTNTMKNLGWGTLLYALAAGVSPAALAAESNNTLEEVIVTAQKREQGLQDISASVSTISGDYLARLGVRSSREIFERMANVSFQASQSEAQPLITMRGIGYQSVQPSAVQPVGLYADDVALNSPQLGGMSVFDLARVEVVRGPQNTLYGRNNTGGAINFVSRKPVVGEEVNGNFSATYGRFNQIDLGGGVSFPLGDKAAMRIALNSQNRDGVRHNLFDDTDVETKDRKQGRVQLAWEASEDVSVLFNVHGGKMDNTSRNGKLIMFLDPTNPDPTTMDLEQGLLGNCPFADKGILGSDCVDSSGITDSANLREVNDHQADGIDRVRTWGTSMKIEWDLGSVMMTSLTAYENLEYRNIRGGGLPVFDLIVVRNQDAEQFSQEVRFTSDQDESLRWVAGAYYFEEDSTTEIIVSFPFLMMGNGGGMFSDNVQKDTSISAFAEVEWDVSEKLTATVGFRYAKDKKSGMALAGLTTNTGGGLAPFAFNSDASEPFLLDDLLALNPPIFAADIPYSETWKDWGGKFALSYQHSDDLLLYASVTRGIKAGGFPTGPNIILADLNGDSGQPGDGLFNNPVDPETVISYEFGFKAQWFDDTLRTNLAVFYNDYQDQQVQTFVLFDQLEGPPVPEGRLINIGNSVIKGFELETVWLPPQIEGARVTFNIGVLDSEIKTDVTGRGLEGNQLTNAPKLTMNGIVEKAWNVNGDNILTLQLDGQYTGSRFFDLNNHSFVQDGSYFVLNAAAHYEFGADQQYRLSFWAKNINNAAYFQNMNETGIGSIQVLPNDPSTYGATINMSF